MRKGIISVLLLFGISVCCPACSGGISENGTETENIGSSEVAEFTSETSDRDNPLTVVETESEESRTEMPEKSGFMDRSLEEIHMVIEGKEYIIPRYVIGELADHSDDPASLGRNLREEVDYLYYPLGDDRSIPHMDNPPAEKEYQDAMEADLTRGFSMNGQSVYISLFRGQKNRINVTQSGQRIDIDGVSYRLKVEEIWSYTSHPEVIRDNTYDPNTGEIKVPVKQEYATGVPLSVIALDLDSEDEYTELFAREGENVIVLRYDGEKLIQLGCMILRNPVLEMDEGFRIPRYRESGVLYEKYTCFAFPLDSDFTFYVPLAEIGEDCLVQPLVEGSACFGCESMERDKYFNTYMRDSLHTWLVKPLTLNTKPDGSGDPIEIQPQQIEFSAVYFDEVPASLEDRTKDGLLTCDALEIRGYEDETIGWIRTSDLSADSFYGRHGSSTDDSLANKDSAGYETISEKPGI